MWSITEHCASYIVEVKNVFVFGIYTLFKSFYITFLSLNIIFHDFSKRHLFNYKTWYIYIYIINIYNKLYLNIKILFLISYDIKFRIKIRLSFFKASFMLLFII